MPLWCGVFRGHLQRMGGPWETAAEALVRIYFGRPNAAFMQPLKTGRHTSPAEDQAWSNSVCGWGRAGAIGGARSEKIWPIRRPPLEVFPMGFRCNARNGVPYSPTPALVCPGWHRNLLRCRSDGEGPLVRRLQRQAAWLPPAPAPEQHTNGAHPRLILSTGR